VELPQLLCVEAVSGQFDRAPLVFAEVAEKCVLATEPVEDIGYRLPPGGVGVEFMEDLDRVAGVMGC
jgi:hypothetical protein